jgi:hypothetical protein
MATKKKTKKKQTKSKSIASKKGTPMKKLAKKSRTPKKKLAKKTAQKKVVVKAKAAGKKAASAKRVSAPKKQGREKSQSVGIGAFSPKGRGPRYGGQSGDLQGLSRVESADSESVDELLGEGNAFEADVVAGVEDAGDAEDSEVHTHEVPEDDVPGEYLDKD